MKLRAIADDKERGLSLSGFMFVIIIVALLAVVALKVVPSVTEYMAVKKALVKARDAGSTAREIQLAFDRQTTAGYIESVRGNDLEITKTSDGFEVSVEYQKQIGLIGPVSLLIDYAASTNNP